MGQPKVKRHYVYKVTCVETGEYYIGKRTCKVVIEKDRYMGSGTILRDKMKYTDRTWVKEILEEYPSEDEAFEGEAHHIGDLWKDDSLCLNLDKGGRGVSSERASEVWSCPKRREWRSQASKDMWDDEMRAKMSAYRKVACNAPAYKEKQREAQKARWTPEACEAVRQQRHDQWTGEVKAKMRATMLNKTSIKLISPSGDKVELVGDEKEALVERLRAGYTFENKSVGLHNPSTKQTIHCKASTSIKILTTMEGWHYGINKSYVGVKVSEVINNDRLGVCNRVCLVSPDGCDFILKGSDRGKIPDLLRQGYSFKAQGVCVNRGGESYTSVSAETARDLILQGGWFYGKLGERKSTSDFGLSYLRKEAGKRSSVNNGVHLVSPSGEGYVAVGEDKARLSELLSEGYTFKAKVVAVNRGDGYFISVSSQRGIQLILSGGWSFGSNGGVPAKIEDMGLSKSRLGYK